MAYTKLIPYFTPGATVEEISGDDQRQTYRLSIPAGPASKYRIAQLDDYAQTRRSNFPLRCPLSLSLSARASKHSIPGTWGFGLWNVPFGLSLGFGGNAFRLPTLPNAVWFFGASEENYLSFREPPAEQNEVQTTLAPYARTGVRTVPGSAGEHRLPSKLQFEKPGLDTNRASTTDFAKDASSSAQREVAANGFLAQTFRSPRFDPSLIAAGLALPFSRKTTRRLLGKIIDEDGIALSVDVTPWHRYRLDWRENEVSFEVDDVQVFESNVSPNPPLGLVIWIDNQYAAFTPEGKIGFGVLANPEPAWLEIKDIEVT